MCNSLQIEHKVSKTHILPIAAVIFDVVRIITFGDDFNLSIWVRRALTTWDIKLSFLKDEAGVLNNTNLFHLNKKDTLIESEGSDPDKAAFLAAARLSTSSA